MIFLAITASDFAEAIALSKVQSFPIWCGSDAVTEKEYRALRGVNLTRFNYPLAVEAADVIAGALDTIAYHHPGENIWVESHALS